MINQAPKYRRRRAVALIVLIALVAAVAIAFSFLTRKPEPKAPIPEPRTPPLSYDGFDAGQIISNQNFINTQTMTEEQIQAFLDDWGYGCREGTTRSGGMNEETGITPSSIKELDDNRQAVPCLKHYHGDMASYPADSYCRQDITGGTNLSAAEIIYRVGQACQINPQVILVTLQKEQGLITASSGKLTPVRYRSAMGYACPDKQNCDMQFAGFSKQVYYAARQWQRYHRDSSSYEYQAQGTYQLKNGPGEECGTSTVTIQNWATASLYNYTPYPPSENARQGVFDECNQAGNLHFYAYYKAWFGDPLGKADRILTRSKAFPKPKSQSDNK